MDKPFVYADHAATTPVSQRALAAMLPYFSQKYGNPSALYAAGYQVKADVENARRAIAKALGARNNEIYFTSGGTESDNWALWGAAERGQGKGRHIITAAGEHSAVYNTVQRMAKMGWDVTVLPIDEAGSLSPERLDAAIRPDTVLVSVMMANNEIGTILPNEELCAVAHRHKVLFHTDAVQAVGHIPVDVRQLGVDMLSFSAHKFGGPKGVGGLYVRYGRTLPPLLTGGGQEKGGRSGTTNAAGIIGMAAALCEAVENMEKNTAHVTALRDTLIKGVLQIPGALLTGDAENRLPGCASFVFSGYTRPPLVDALGKVGICASAGSSCSAGSGDPSRILLAAGYPASLAWSSLRLTLGADNTRQDIEYIVDTLPKILQEVKQDQEQLEKVLM